MEPLQKKVPPMSSPRRPYIANGDDAWKRYLDGGLRGVSEAVVLEGGRRVKLSWVDGHESHFSLKWLRDHSSASYNVATIQREVMFREGRLVAVFLNEE